MRSICTCFVEFGHRTTCAMLVFLCSASAAAQPTSGTAAGEITMHTCTGHKGASCRTLEVDAASAVSPTPCDSDELVIDILWVVTVQAMEYMGGPDVVLAEVQHAMSKADEAFANTTLPYSVALVGLHVTDYPVWDSGYLYQIQNPNDGVMDEVHLVRDAKAADIVSLITIEGYCGVAFVAPDNSDYGFQGNSADCLLADWASPMRHELGHNLGSRHYTSDPGGYLPYSSGHVLDMGNGTAEGTCMGGNSIPHYSNPNVSWQGVPTGIAPGEEGEADNFTAFTQTVPMVADFRCSSTACRSDVDFDGHVGVDDLLSVLNAWGPAAATPSDVVVDGQCNVDDLLLIVGNWGPCT